jgi:hypothetical protein
LRKGNKEHQDRSYGGNKRNSESDCGKYTSVEFIAAAKNGEKSGSSSETKQKRSHY